jgi:Uma2 family endonuclease
MTTKTRVSLSDFLAMPETKPYKELIDGEIVEKAMPGAKHGELTSQLITSLGIYLRSTREAHLQNEVRHADRDHEWVFLPDISVTLKSRRPLPAALMPDGPVEILPDFAIEVLSPEDRPGRLAQRIAYYMRAGVTLLWVVDPEEEQVTIWERGAEPRVAVRSETIDAKPVLSDFTLDLGELFDTLHRA